MPECLGQFADDHPETMFVLDNRIEFLDTFVLYLAKNPGG